MAELDLNAIDALLAQYDTAIGPGGDKAWRAGQLAQQVRPLVAEVRRLRSAQAWHTDGPGPDVSVVYDRDGDEWVRRLDQWSCEGDGELIRWGLLVDEWGPLTAERKAADR